MTEVVRTNSVSTYVNEAQPTTAKGSNRSSVAIRSSSGYDCYTFVHFSGPVPKDVDLEESTLKVRVKGTWTGPVTIRVREVTERWVASQVTYNTRPNISAAFVDVTVPDVSIPDGTIIEIPVTSIVKHSQTSKAWYGFRIQLISPTSTTARYLYGSGVEGPQLYVRYQEKIDAATRLSPGIQLGGDAVSVARPQPDLTAQFDPNVAGISITGVRVQTTTAETSGSPNWAGAWDSGMVATTDPYLRISDIVGSPNPAADGYVWWRLIFQASNGKESPWSAPYKYFYKPYGVLTMTGPNDPMVTSTPTVSWTFTGTGRIQEFYQIFVLDVDSGNPTPLWDSGRVQSNPVTSVQIPKNKITETGKTYRIVLRVWDTIKRQGANDNAGSMPTYTQVTKDIVYSLDATVSPVTSLVGTHDGPSPVERLTWTSASEPTFFEIVRDGKVVETDIDPDLLQIGVSTSYTYLDRTASPLADHVWEVRRIVSDKTSANNPTVAGNFFTSLAWLSDFETDTHIAIAGESPAEIGLYEQGTTFEPLNSGVPVHITQSLGDYRGKVSGVLCGDCLKDGTTSEDLQSRLMALRDRPGAVYYFYLANIAVPVVIYNVSTYPLYGARFGKSYGVEFEWHQVGG